MSALVGIRRPPPSPRHARERHAEAMSYSRPARAKCAELCCRPRRRRRVHQSSHKLVDEVGRLQPRELERGHAPTVAPDAQYAQIIERVPAHPKCPTVVTGVEQDLPNHRQHAHSGHDAMVTPRYQSRKTQLTRWHPEPSAHRTSVAHLSAADRVFSLVAV